MRWGGGGDHSSSLAENFFKNGARINATQFWFYIPKLQDSAKVDSPVILTIIEISHFELNQKQKRTLQTSYVQIPNIMVMKIFIVLEF